MTDSFADLWNSTAPSTTKPVAAPPKLGQALSSAPGQNARKPTNDIFSMLATPSTSNPATRSTTPLYTNVNASHSARASPILPSNTGGRGSQTPIQKTSSANGGGDAFSGLLSGTFSSSSANLANLTIAQRAALVEKQKSEKLLGSQRTSSAHPQQSHDAWAGLDSLAAPSASLSSNATPSSSAQTQEDIWDFGLASAPKPSAPAPAVSQPTPTLDDDDFGLGEFTSKPAASQPMSLSNEPPSSQKDIWDFDEFSSPPVQASKTPRSPEPSIKRSNSPGDFDFGDREGALLDGQSDDEDDILGDLTKPVDQIRPVSTTPAAQNRANGQNSRPVSPPPHILGQIVEMGFSIQQARVALAATDTGLDVQAALETLLSNGAAGGSSTPPSISEEPRERAQTRSPARQPPQSRRGEEAPRRRAPVRDRESETPSPGLESLTQKNLQEQADKLLAQASEIGLSMFNRANAFWREGKEKVQKVYEERAAASAGRGGSSKSGALGRDGRPKWMQDAEEHQDDEGWKSPNERSGFRDDEDGRDEVLPPKPRAAAAPRREPEPSSSSRLQTGDLLGGDSSPSVYRSPFRYKSSSRSQTPASSSKSTPVPQPARAPSPIALVQRQTVSASPSALSTSTKHKDAGAEAFKLGQFAEAEKAYTQAISALPPSHLLLIPLYNNRALTRLKTGDHSGAIEDTTLVLNLIGPSYHPSREAKVTKEDEGASVDIADGYVKALRRRAEAYEGKEKWDFAQKDWEAVAATEWANGKLRSEAVTRSGRCRKMLSVDMDDSSKPTPSAAPSKPKPPISRAPPPRVNVTPQNSEAVKRVREANQAAEAEDEARHQLKDVVDAKLAAWKKGKETNIRALIASLETVLWPELGWQKVGMHELVTPNQVKIRYTKAIAKLHPDKLSAMKLTVEQRMIANGVFGALNEAWNAFKP
ncbi:hypothetical protein K474DRAFT_1662302 [Panus rudis PR-1116 ss-1]|nr:hypothetical protein K474DRAFT_1662302 [Panus rudis PR-1116 ss-1]